MPDLISRAQTQGSPGVKASWGPLCPVDRPAGGPESATDHMSDHRGKNRMDGSMVKLHKTELIFLYMSR